MYSITTYKDTWSRPFGTCMRPILFRNCRYFTGLCSSNIPRYFLDFALLYVTEVIKTLQMKIEERINGGVTIHRDKS